MLERVTYTKEEIESRVKVPAIVEVELKHLVEERLKQCGLYYRIFSRIKTADSLARKYQIKEYNEKKKIQDLVGLRIDVYFEDDLRVCQRMMENMFDLVEWAETEQNEIEFKPVKINGVFRLPSYLSKQISAETWGMCIDDTVEIQLKTVFFEGWHEIEHDMKYKGGELWLGKNSFARYFNSILATLELCDKSLVTLFENLGHDLYKEGNWAGMMKAHYRLKMEERPMYPELEQLLSEDRSEKNLGKQLFKTNRQVLIDALLNQPRRVPINVNTIVALVNQAVIHDERLETLFHEKDVFDDGNEQLGEELSFHRMEPLRKSPVFHAKVNLSTYRYDRHAGCLEAARLAYQWIYEKYGRLFANLPMHPTTLERNMLGYRIIFQYEPDRDYWKLCATNVDLEAPGQVWVVNAECYLADNGKQMLEVSNAYAVAEERKNLNRYFSCPRFYSNIADRIGVFDVRYCSTSRRILRSNQIRKIADLIRSTERTFPVCLFFSAERENGWLNEDWLDAFRVYDFTRMAGRYTHIYTGNLEMGRLLMEALGLEWSEEPGAYVFRTGYCDEYGQVNPILCECYREDDIKNCSYGRHQRTNEGRRYGILKGGQAFYYKMLYEMRSEITE
ncbi:MAG: hypothetical protein PUB22_00830 [Clostridiales bacterium]|nr:hypothetical protein [Clostridiales bacterium]